MHPSQNKILNSNISVDFGCLLGKGSTGNVFKGVCLQPYFHHIAVKIIPLQSLNNQVKCYLFHSEIQALKTTTSLKSNKIVRLKDIIVADQQCFIAMELINGSTLQQLLQRQYIQENAALDILKQILQGYQVMKKCGIVHRDLKPSNIMVCQDKSIKIIDFGYCEIDRAKNKPKMHYNVGSPRYMSPQAYKQSLYSEKSDIWGIGMIFYQMLTGKTPDKGKSIPESLKSIKEIGIPLPQNLSRSSKGLLKSMLAYSPKNRPTCESLLSGLNEYSIQAMERQGQKNIRILSGASIHSPVIGKLKNISRIEESKLLIPQKNKIDLMSSQKSLSQKAISITKPIKVNITLKQAKENANNQYLLNSCRTQRNHQLMSRNDCSLTPKKNESVKKIVFSNKPAHQRPTNDYSWHKPAKAYLQLRSDRPVR